MTIGNRIILPQLIRHDEQIETKAAPFHEMERNESQMPGKNKKRLRARVNVGRDDNGNVIYMWASAYTKRELEEEKKRIAEEYRSEPKPKAQAETFESFTSRWYRLYKEPDIRQSTKTMYHNVLHVHLFPALGALPVNQITGDILQEYINTLAGKSESLINKIVLTLRQIFDKAVDDDLLSKSPAKNIRPPQGTVNERLPVPMEDVAKLTNAAAAHPYGLLPIIMMYAGLRRGEALALRWEDIFDGQIHVRRALNYEESNRAVIGDTKTPSAIRAIPIVPILQTMLDKLEHSQNGFVFGGAKPLPYSTFCRHWEKLQRDIRQMDGVTPHQLRHTYLMLLRRAGVDPKTQQYLMGHSDYQTTANIYTHINTYDIVDAAAAMNSALPQLLPELLPKLLPRTADN